MPLWLKSYLKYFITGVTGVTLRACSLPNGSS